MKPGDRIHEIDGELLDNKKLTYRKVRARGVRKQAARSVTDASLPSSKVAELLNKMVGQSFEIVVERWPGGAANIDFNGDGAVALSSPPSLSPPPVTRAATASHKVL
jgi:hypothetical protein